MYTRIWSQTLNARLQVVSAINYLTLFPPQKLHTNIALKRVALVADLQATTDHWAISLTSHPLTVHLQVARDDLRLLSVVASVRNEQALVIHSHPRSVKMRNQGHHKPISSSRGRCGQLFFDCKSVFGNLVFKIVHIFQFFFAKLGV